MAGTTGATFDGTVTATGFISSAADPADAGLIRLGNAETIAWENATPGTDLTLTVDSNNILTSSVPINATTGFRIGNAATTGTFLAANGTNYVASGVITDGDGIQRNDTSFVTAPLRFTPQGRLTLTSATPVTVSDVTAATTVYYALYKGDVVPLFDGTRWKLQTFTEQSIKTTDTQNGSTSDLSAVITGLTDTSQFMRGMEVTGTSIPVGATISSIDSSTQVTISAPVTTGAPDSITFKLPTSKNYDIFYVQSSSEIQFSNSWTDADTRADALTTQNGLEVNNAAINSADSNTIAAKKGLYLGTIRTLPAGQTEDSAAHRYVWNNYNRVRRTMVKTDATSTWTYSTASYQPANNDGNNAIDFVIGLNEEPVEAHVYASVVNSTTTARNTRSGISIDSTTTTNSATVSESINVTSVQRGEPHAAYKGYPGLGYHYLTWLEQGGGTDTQTWTGDNAAGRETGIFGEISN